MRNCIVSIPQDGRTDQYIYNALIRLGYNVTIIDHRRNPELAFQQLDYKLSQEKIDFVLVLHLFPGQTYTKEQILKLRHQYGVKFYCWYLDGFVFDNVCKPPSEVEWFVDLVGSYDCFYTISDKICAAFNALGINCKVMDEGYDDSIGWSDEDYISHDVNFIGSFGFLHIHTERMNYLSKIGEKFDLGVYGKMLCKKPDDLKFKYYGRDTYNDFEHNLICYNSKINWSYTDNEISNGTFSSRVYKVLSSGGFLLHNRTDMLEKYFEDGTHLVMYDGIDDCLEKIKHYLEYEGERKEIAECGMECISDFTFKDSLKQLCQE